MPKVGTKKFAYTKAGMKKAKQYAKSSGKKVQRRLQRGTKMASTGGGGMGMGGGPDSAPGGSSSSSGTGNAPGEGMGADAFGGGGQASKDTSTIEGFRAALAKALGQVTQEQKDTAVEAQEEAANQRARNAAVEARDKAIRDAADLGELNSGMMGIDNDDDNDRGLLGPSIDDPQGTQKGLDAEQAARDAMESSRDVNKNVDIGIGPETPKDAFRNEESKRMGQTLEALDRDPSPEVASASLDDDPFGGTMAEKEREALALSFVNDAEKEYDRIMKETKAFSKERSLALRNLNAIKNTDLFSKSYAIANPSAMRDMLAKAMALFSGLGPAVSIAKAIESRAVKAGMFDRTTFDQMMSALDDPGAFGPLGNPLGTGGANQNNQEKKIRDILAVVEPWTKGLNKRQIEYYYDNEEELDWVRNLYEQMNKSASA